MFEQNKLLTENANHKRIQLLETRLADSQSPQEEVDVLAALAWELRISQPGKAQAFAVKAVDLAQTGIFLEHPYKQGWAAGLVALAFCQTHRNQLKTGMENSLQAINFLEDTQPSKIKTRAFLTLSWNHFFLGNYPVALEESLKALKTSDFLGHLIDKAWALDELACIYGITGDFQSALGYHREAIALFKELNDIDGSIRATNNLAMTLYEKQNYTSALEIVSDSLELAQHWDRKPDIVNIFCTVAQINIEMEQLEQAEKYLQAAVDIAEGLETLTTYYTHVLMERARLAWKKNDLQKAQSNLFLALEKAEGNGQKTEMAECHRNLSAIYEEQDNFQRALRHQRIFHKLNEEVIGEKAAIRISVLSLTHEIETAHQEAEIYRLKAEQLRSDMERQNELAKYEERRRMGRDLHDSVNQSIHSLMLSSETLQTLLEKGNTEQAIPVAEHIKRSGLQALKEVRLLLYETQSPLADVGISFLELLEERLSMVERRIGLSAEIIVLGEADAYCPVEWNENLYWLTLEALNNALKYAKARSVKISFCCKGRSLELDIEDDGIGFDIDRQKVGGLGMRTMRERAELLGGDLNITSTPGKGTRVSFRIRIDE
jgi:signal transduction histidine kinase